MAMLQSPSAVASAWWFDLIHDTPEHPQNLNKRVREVSACGLSVGLLVQPRPISQSQISSTKSSLNWPNLHL